jgi:hypothetical protein
MINAQPIAARSYTFAAGVFVVTPRDPSLIYNPAGVIR